MKKLIIRNLWFILGILINSFGIALITKAALGTSQISSVPYVLSLKYCQLTFGEFTFIFNTIFILVQLILLKRDFHPIQFLQLAVNLIFSWFIDASMGFLSFLEPQGIAMKLIFLLVGCVVLSVGISIEVAPNVLTVPGEGIVKAIATVSRKKFGTVKVVFDISLIAIAVVLSLLFFQGLYGVGLGTVVSALLVGRFVNLWNAHFPLIKKIRVYSNLPETDSKLV